MRRFELQIHLGKDEEPSSLPQAPSADKAPRVKDASTEMEKYTVDLVTLDIWLLDRDIWVRVLSLSGTYSLATYFASLRFLLLTYLH